MKVIRHTDADDAESQRCIRNPQGLGIIDSFLESADDAMLNIDLIDGVEYSDTALTAHRAVQI